MLWLIHRVCRLSALHTLLTVVNPWFKKYYMNEVVWVLCFLDYINRLFIYTSLSIAARSRIGVANMARQRVLTVASAGTVVCSSVSETSSIVSPAHISHSMLGHSTPVSYTAPHTRPATGSDTHQQIHDVRLNTPSQYRKTCTTLYIFYPLYRVVEVTV